MQTEQDEERHSGKYRKRGSEKKVTGRERGAEDTAMERSGQRQETQQERQPEHDYILFLFYLMSNLRLALRVVAILNLHFSWTQALCSMLCLKLVCYFFSCFQAEYWGPGNECITVVYLSEACTEGSLVVPTSTTELPSVHAPLCWGCRKRCCSNSWQNPIWFRINIPTTPQDRRGVY